jgi:retron-type reverse transcriptase
MLDNYRPISILPVVSKLIERISYNQISEYLEKESILSEYQFGFRSCHSTTTTLIDCTNEWCVNMDRGHYNVVVFLDIKKAFDTVNHDILLKKLEMYGLGESALALLRNYLTDRTKKFNLQGML